MSISNIGMSGKTPLMESLREQEKQARSSPALNQLSQVTDKASLSAMAPRLQHLLQAIDHPSDNVLQTMSDNISSLQDAFVEAVSHTLIAENVDLSQKVTLRLNAEGSLGLAGEHPEKERISEILAQSPELSAAFREIASQSEVLRDVNNISKVIGSQTGLASYQNAGLPQESVYQISLKGEMSHFYFSK